jgi:hypothetical protein
MATSNAFHKCNNRPRAFGIELLLRLSPAAGNMFLQDLNVVSR